MGINPDDLNLIIEQALQKCYKPIRTQPIIEKI